MLMDEEEDDYEKLSHFDRSFDQDDDCEEESFKMTHTILNHSAKKEPEKQSNDEVWMSFGF